jgi:large subunit ribosomal protein L14e
MIEIGRVCVKIAGRDAGLKCVVVEDLGKNLVLIDGQTRRRKCNVAHLEPIAQKLDISKGASHDQVVKAFKSVEVSIVERKSKAKAPAQKAAAAPAEKPKVAKKPAVKKAPEKKVEAKSEQSA